MIFRSFQAVLLFILLSGLFVIASESSEKQIETKRSGYWTYYCINFEKQRQCKIARKINIEEQNETFLIIYNVTKDISSKVKESLNITTPPAPRVNIKKRLKISFDNKTKFRSFLKCESDGCLVIFKGNRMLKYSLKNFNKMKITFYVSEEEEEPTSLTLPMDGFAEALNNINQRLE